MSFSLAILSILLVSLTHSELTTPVDVEVVARGKSTIVPVSDADIATRPDVDASDGEFVVLVVFF